MVSVFIAVGAFFAYLIAYHTYGKFVSRRLFGLDDANVTPANSLRDDQDYVPTRAEVLFGHHFTSIAGTMPIVGPALAIIWGWVPALLWVVFGAIFMGAVHDLSALVISLRHRGRSIGDVARELVSARVRVLFLGVIFFLLLMVIALFVLIIAILFSIFPVAVFPVWIEIPIAVALGWAIYRKGASPLAASLVAVAALYVCIVIGAYWPIGLPDKIGAVAINPVLVWGALLLVYAYIASTLPVWRLLQPRDYINGHELFVALGLLALGIVFARPEIVAPAVQTHPEGAPPMWPMLFVVIACGAISGFHSLVGSGTTSKQLSSERHAMPIGYGAMLVESMLSVLVIIAVAAGVGMAMPGEELGGAAAWQARYASWGAAQGLGAKVDAFVQGAANMLTAVGVPMKIGLALMGVFVASFAATTLDSATRLQRYVVAEFADIVRWRPLANKHVATLVAVVTAALVAAPKSGPGAGYGTGGLVLLPLFGTINQLLACLALLVATVYLKRRGKPLVYTMVPMLVMFVITSWAMVLLLQGFWTKMDQQWHLFLIGAIILALELWMIVESLAVIVTFKAPSLDLAPEMAGDGSE